MQLRTDAVTLPIRQIAPKQRETLGTRCHSWISSGTQGERLGRQRAREIKTDRRDRQLDVGVCDALALIPIDPAAFSYQPNDLKSVCRTARRRFLLDTFLGREISNLPATSFRDSLRFTSDSVERNALSLGAIEASNQMQDCCVKCFSSPALGHQTTHVCANAQDRGRARRKRCGGRPLLPYQNFKVQSVLDCRGLSWSCERDFPSLARCSGRKSAIGGHLSCSIFISGACVRSRVSRRQTPHPNSKNRQAAAVVVLFRLQTAALLLRQQSLT